MRKIWVDDTRSKPDGYDWHCRSVNETISLICGMAKNDFALIDLDHDAGDYAYDGGDYIKILDFIEEKGLNNDNRFCFRIHSMNIVGRQNMIRIINHLGWELLP